MMLLSYLHPGDLSFWSLLENLFNILLVIGAPAAVIFFVVKGQRVKKR